MKMVKSLLLGAAAGLVAVAGAQAADLPVKAKPVQYVKICSLYGAGFYYMPGTDTCIKVGGWVRAEINFGSGGSFNPDHVATLDSRAYNNETMRTRGIITVDARSQTEYGTLRSYITGGFQATNGVHTEVYAPRAFVQFAGFTAGLAQSFFDFYVTPAYSNTTNVLGSDTGGGGQFVFGYTAQFGNGLSATISVEEPETRRTQIGVAAVTGGVAFGLGGGARDYGGRRWPDVSANLRIDQAWGSAQIMGALHDVYPAWNPGSDADEVGWAVGAGLKVNLPMLGKGDSISMQAAYSQGAMRYVGSGLTTFAITSGTVATTGYGPVADAIWNGTSLDLTEGWSVVAGYQHAWNAAWKTSLYGTYGELDYNDAVVANADWAFYQVGSRTIWTPVKNLDLSVDVMYNHIDTAFDGTAGFADKGWWQGIFRVQRNFYP